MGECRLDLKDKGGAVPRSCSICGLGPCQKRRTENAAPSGKEGIASPMGWFYRVDPARVGVEANPSVYRCKLGQAWERMEIYDIGELTSAELRFVADVIDASKSKIEAA